MPLWFKEKGVHVQTQRNYYAIIPANVRYDTDLNANAKLLYGEITALCNEKGFCWATNNYFAELYNKNKSTIARWIKDLEEKGYIQRKVIYKKGTLEIERRYMQICNNPIRKNETTPMRKNAIDNNTSFNITDEYKEEDASGGDPIVNALIENNIVSPGGLTATLRDDINDIFNNFGFDEPEKMILEAIKDATRGNGRTWKFVYNKLNLWSKQGLTDPDKVQVSDLSGKPKRNGKKVNWEELDIDEQETGT